ncbi:MAG TPA: recombinase family protein [Vicinamibacterales bacterium]|nr:recombinase family protein [Vicinamibacterales bacterium]
MPTMRVRETVWEPPSPHHLMEKARKGWTLVALEWEREMSPEEAASMGLACDVPFGLRIAANSLTLEEDAQERTILTAMLDLLVQDDLRFSEIARELNQKGYRRRGGQAWTQSAVFEMLPRLVEVAPTILKSDQWEALKSRL